MLNTHGCVCGRCTKVCPWSHEDCGPEVYKDWDGDVEWLKARADARAEDLRKNNFKNPGEETDKWWFDLAKETMDGPLAIPHTTKMMER